MREPCVLFVWAPPKWTVLPPQTAALPRFTDSGSATGSAARWRLSGSSPPRIAWHSGAYQMHELSRVTSVSATQTVA